MADAANAGIPNRGQRYEDHAVGAFFGHLARELECQASLPGSSWTGERNQAYGGVCEPVPQRLQVSIAAQQGGNSEGQRDGAEFIERRVVSGCPRAPQ